MHRRGDERFFGPRSASSSHNPEAVKGFCRRNRGTCLALIAVGTVILIGGLVVCWIPPLAAAAPAVQSTPMRFEERELKPYVEPVSASELKEGAVYFSVTFVDDDMLYPIMEPLVFIGRNLKAGDVGQVYFQDLGSYRQGIRYDSSAIDRDVPFNSSTAVDRAAIESGSEDEVNHIFEYERALDVLMRCALRRRKPAGAG